MKIGDKTLNNVFEFLLLSFHFSIIILPIVNINSQLSLSFRGIVTLAKLASIVDS